MFEPDAGGHRLTYLRQLLPALDGLGEVTVVVGEGAIATEAFRVQLGALRETHRFESVAFDKPPSRLGKARARLDALRSAMDLCDPEHIYIPSGDGLAQLMGLPGSRTRLALKPGVQIEVGMHRGSFAYPARGAKDGLTRSLALRALTRAPIVRAQFVDVLAYEWLRDRGHPLAKRASVLADPVDPVELISKNEARRVLGMPEGGRVIGTSGHLDERKGVDRLLRAFRAADMGESDRLLLAGRPSPGIRELLAGEFAPMVESGRIVALTRYLSDEELGATLAACDVVCTCHPAHVGLSNICLRAAAAGRPVLSGDYGWFQRVVGGFGLGWTCRVTDEDVFARTIRESLERCDSFEPGPRVGELLAFHSQANARRTFVAHLRGRLGLERDPGLIEWETLNR